MMFSLQIAQQGLFLISLLVVSFLLWRRIRFIKQNIRLGKNSKTQDNKAVRLKKMLLVAFGQQKMFDRPLAGFMHLAVYVGFLLINIEVLEIILDGITGKHRLFSGVLGTFYPFLINFFECFAVAVVAACIVFLVRRNMLKTSRFIKPEMKGWPSTDANIILVWEILLMFALYTMNATDSAIQNHISHNEYISSHYTPVGSFVVSSFLVPLYENMHLTTLTVIERASWWIHILGIMSFAIYVTYSKHLHIVLAFPNVYYSKISPLGQMYNMPEITKEVKIMLGQQADQGDSTQEVSRFGAKDVTDLSWKNLLQAYTCTECGRCTAECPANQTGKKLSPRKIMMDTRDRAEDLGKYIACNNNNSHDRKTLYNDYISKEEIMACTTCNACVQACPVGIDPLSIILQIRRYMCMEESDTPTSWNVMFKNIENNYAPWAFSPTNRFKWTENLKEEK